MFSRFVHVTACVSASFCFCPNNILLYGWTTFYSPVYLLMDTRLFLPFVNHATVNIHTHVFAWMCFHFSWVDPRGGIAGSDGNCVYLSEELPDCHTAAAPFYVLTSNARGFQFLRIHANTCCLFFHYSLPQNYFNYPHTNPVSFDTRPPQLRETEAQWSSELPNTAQSDACIRHPRNSGARWQPSGPLQSLSFLGRGLS